MGVDLISIIEPITIGVGKNGVGAGSLLLDVAQAIRVEIGLAAASAGEIGDDQLGTKSRSRLAGVEGVGCAIKAAQQEP